jgi:hypothetical protein
MNESKKIDKRLKKRPFKETYGRNLKNIDWDLVDELLFAGCLGTEIAPHFDMHVNTFYKRLEEEKGISFTEYSSIKRCQGDSLLRKVQYDKALKRDNAMMIWLGKQRLGQKETTDISFDKDMVSKFHSTMNQFKQMQEDRKISSNSDEQVD